MTTRRLQMTKVEETGASVAGACSDEDLMARFVHGDESAFVELHRRYAPGLVRFLRRMLADMEQATDLMQASFLSVVQSKHRYREGAPVRPWLYAIAANAARSHLRRLPPKETKAILEAEPVEVAAVERDTGLERAVHQALLALPEGQREVVVMHRFEGLSFSEIARALDLTESAAKVRAHRGYAQLRILLESVR